MEQQALADLPEEARRLTDAANARGIAIRLMGGVAVFLRCPSARTSPLKREYGDLDFAGLGRQRQDIEQLFADLGYAPDREINVIYGRERLIFFDVAHQRQVDIILDSLRMCHVIELGSRLSLEPATLTLADLLLSKLQVVETTNKDFQDLAALLVDHALKPGPGDWIDIDRIRSLCSDDWGLWRTVTQVASSLPHAADSWGQPLGGPFALADQTATLIDAIAGTPKSLRWKRRALIGDRVRWYELPEGGKSTLWDS